MSVLLRTQIKGMLSWTAWKCTDLALRVPAIYFGHKQVHVTSLVLRFSCSSLQRLHPVDVLLQDQSLTRNIPSLSLSLQAGFVVTELLRSQQLEKDQDNRWYQRISSLILLRKYHLVPLKKAATPAHHLGPG